MDMNILKYMAFIKAVEYGSFTRAAEVLNYSQYGVSRMIHDLEKEWNITLLERNRGGIRLTSDGSRLLPYAQSLCTEYQKLQMQVDDLHGVQSGIIRIGTFSSGAIHWVPNIIKAFQKDYPGIDYELLLGDYTEIEDWIAQGRVDCGFLRLPTRPDFDTIPLGRDRLLAILPQNHPLTQYDRPLPPWRRNPSCCWKRGPRPRSPRCSSATGSSPGSISLPGTTTPLWPWWKAAWG